MFNGFMNEWMNASISEFMYECMNGFLHLAQYLMDSASVLLISVPANTVNTVMSNGCLLNVTWSPKHCWEKKKELHLLSSSLRPDE